MNNIILSIKPQYVDLILAGVKTYEYRKKIPKKDVNMIYIYSSSPVMQVVASVKVLSCLKESPIRIWELTKDFSGLTFEQYNKYFSQTTVAYAYKLGTVNIFEKPLSLMDLGIRFAPQSFRYVSSEMHRKLKIYNCLNGEE